MLCLHGYTVDEEVPNNLVNNGVIYQPQLVSRISDINSSKPPILSLISGVIAFLFFSDKLIAAKKCKLIGPDEPFNYV